MLLCTASYLATLIAGTLTMDYPITISLQELGILRLPGFGPKYPLSRLSMSESPKHKDIFITSY